MSDVVVAELVANGRSNEAAAGRLVRFGAVLRDGDLLVAVKTA